MSPEQVLARRRRTQRTDVFAFGCVLYECLTGRRAFAGARRARDRWRAVARTTRRTSRCCRRARRRALRDAARAHASRRTPDAAPRRPARPSRHEIEDALGIRRAAALRAGEARRDAAQPAAPGHELRRPRGRARASARALLADDAPAHAHRRGRQRQDAARARARGGGARDAIPTACGSSTSAPLTDPERVRRSAGRRARRARGARAAARSTLLERLRARPQAAARARQLRAPARGLRGGSPARCSRRARTSRVLATSREALGVAGEAVLRACRRSRCPARGAGDAERSCDARPCGCSSSARAPRSPDFALTDDERGRRRRDLPPARRHPARDRAGGRARARARASTQIRARLDDRFRLLTARQRRALPRQQTLRATIQWSYDHLLPPTSRSSCARSRCSPAAGRSRARPPSCRRAATSSRCSTCSRGSSTVARRRRAHARPTRYRFLETVASSRSRS